MEIGLKSSTRGLLLVCLIRGFGPVRVLCGVCWGGGSAQEDALCFPHTTTHNNRPAVMAEEKLCFLTQPLHSLSNLSYLRIIRRKDGLR